MPTPPTAPASVDHLLGPLGTLPDPLPIPTLASVGAGRRMDVLLRPPGSKSLTNRALLLGALAGGESRLRGALLDADDARVMMDGLRKLGATITTSDDQVVIRGVGGCWKPQSEDVELDLGNAGTAVRFLAASSCLCPSPVSITGDERMRQRPIGDLAGALVEMGARIEALGEPGCPPIRIVPPSSPPACTEVYFESPPSSQFISAMLMLGPFLEGGISIEIEGEVTSASYVRMTLGLLDVLGARLRSSADLRVLRVAPGPPGGPLETGFELDIEPDASGASVFWAAAASKPNGRVAIAGVDDEGLQGDLAFPGVLARMGAGVRIIRRGDASEGPSIRVAGGERLGPVMADMREMPDAALALAVLAGMADGRSVIRGLHTLRVKETDRLHALQTELAKVGVAVELDVLGEAGAITIDPPPGGLLARTPADAIEFDTYNDHRMAMSLALVGLHRPNVSIRDPGCVAKTYAGFWADLARLYVS
ncbi:MAG: 3-phosphoshikimate 1-carboxyvinyltransferase [Planctomycetota bacterium]